MLRYSRILHTGHNGLLSISLGGMEGKGTDLPASPTPGAPVAPQTVCLSVQVRTYYSLHPSGEKTVFDLGGCLAIGTPPVEKDCPTQPLACHVATCPPYCPRSGERSQSEGDQLV